MNGPWTPSRRVRGAVTRVLGSLAVVLGAVLVTTPGVGAAATTVSLEHLGRPVITAPCAGGLEKAASPHRALTAEGDRSIRAGVELVGAPCDTSFTWTVPSGYATFRARLELDIADSGTEAVSFFAGGHRRVARRVTRSGTVTRVPYSGALVTVRLAGATRFTIEMPNGGSDAGEVIVTNDAFVH